jgi:drug/metabolite transporter (DMT)-like permease
VRPLRDRRLLAGAGLALLSSLGFSALTIFAVLTYREGANPLAAVIVRFPGAIIVLIVLLLTSGISMRLKRRETMICWGLGVLLGGQSYALYKSFEIIPVALTMIIFYVYPLIVGVVAGVTGQDRMSRALAVALVVAFAGLVLVFNVSGTELTGQGALYAALAAILWAAMTLLGVRVMRDCDPRAASLNMQVSAAAIFIVISLVSGGVTPPASAVGWVTFLAMPLCYAIAITGFFAAVSRIGSIRASLFMNFEPVLTISLGFVVLGQSLTPLQLAGGALVVGAIVALKWDAEGRVAETG